MMTLIICRILYQQPQQPEFPIFSWLTSGKTILDDITRCAGRKSASMARLP